MSKALQHRINAGRVAVKEQVHFFHHQFGRVPSEWKADETRVTFADFAISERIFALLRASFPDDAYCSEESNPADEAVSLKNGYGWILDPIDGTNNYALGIPFCAISLALLKHGMPVYGFVYDMSRRTLIEGGPEFGLLDGPQKAQMSAGALQKQSILGLNFPLTPEVYAAMQPALGRYRVRSTGSAALNAAYAAIGKLDGSLDFRVKVWDIAAACALIQAGGGEFHFLAEPLFPIATFHPSMPASPYVAGNASVCAELLSLLKPVWTKPASKP